MFEAGSIYIKGSLTDGKGRVRLAIDAPADELLIYPNALHKGSVSVSGCVLLLPLLLLPLLLLVLLYMLCSSSPGPTIFPHSDLDL